jgi:hypothetical protein
MSATSQQCILNPDEQNAFRKHSNEIKQLSGLVILKTGLGVQECKLMSQKAQDDAYSKQLRRSEIRCHLWWENNCSTSKIPKHRQ